MEIILIVAFIAAIALVLSKKKKQQKAPPTFVDDVVNVRPEPAPIPIGNWCYIDDMVLSLTQDKGGDYNAPQDLAAVLAIAVKFNSLPLFIGVTSIRNKGTGLKVAQDIVKASGLNIPVYSGSPTYNGKPSELSKQIIKHSKNKLSVCLGSPATDLAVALKGGANASNIKLHALLEDTWNEDNPNAPQFKIDADYVQFKIRDKHEIPFPQFLILIKVKASYAKAFIEKNMNNKMWVMVNNNFVRGKNRAMNNAQGLTAGDLRIADCLTVLDYFGIDVYKNPNRMFGAIQHGLDLIRARLD